MLIAADEPVITSQPLCEILVYKGPDRAQRDVFWQQLCAAASHDVDGHSKERSWDVTQLYTKK